MFKLIIYQNEKELYILSGCDQEDGDESFNYLDVSSIAPLTRSSAADLEGGATQSIGGSSTSPFSVPINDNECMLWSILTIAAENHIPITMSDGTTTKKIGYSYTAEQAYNYIKGIATSKTFPACDVNGDEIDGQDPYNYGGGAMFPSIAKSIGKQVGILKGELIHFDSYDKLQEHIQRNIQDGNLKSGKYIISSEDGKHATVGKGIDKRGNIRYTDSKNNSSKYEDYEKVGGWTLIY